MWAGIDVGDRSNGFHAAVVDERRVVAGPSPFRTPQEVVAFLLRLVPNLVALDSPIAAAPEGERLRKGERLIRAGVCGIRWTPDRASLAANPSYFGWVLHGFELYAALEEAGLAAIECFPTASWTRWFGPKGTAGRAAWTREGLRALGLEGVPARTSQHDRDAIAAALTARQHDRGETEAFGEIVVPVTRPEPARQAAPSPALVHGVSYLGLRTRDIARLRRFYVELTAAEPFEGTHEQLRLGSVVLGFWQSNTPPGRDAIGFDVDAAGFEDVLERAGRLGLEIEGPRRYNPWSRGFEVLDPDGRRLEFVHNDPSAFWANG